MTRDETTMTKTHDYRATLQTLTDWEPFLLKSSGLPGPRANLELMQAVADEGKPALFRRYASLTPAQAPTNSPEVFLVCCGVVGLGRLLAEGDEREWKPLRRHANDPRWRVREAVVLGLQRLGDIDMQRLLPTMLEWGSGNGLEQRAAVAVLCEPRLLKGAASARATLRLLDEVTAAVAATNDRRCDAFQVLRKSLGYCWSVATTALPETGKPLMEKWLASADSDVRWIMRENLTKARLSRMDEAWVKRCRIQTAR